MRSKELSQGKSKFMVSIEVMITETFTQVPQTPLHRKKYGSRTERGYRLVYGLMSGNSLTTLRGRGVHNRESSRQAGRLVNKAQPLTEAAGYSCR